MFISRLIQTIECYDPYGLHRLNGMKVVYVLFILFLFNFFLNIPNVYFYYFYVPITAMSVEVVYERIKDKYYAFIATVLGTCLMVLLFDLFSPFPLFFLFAVFVCAALLYLMALRWLGFFMPLVPIILSLAAYSLLYPDLNINLRMAIDNLLTTLFALCIVLLSLWSFPLSYYYRLWLRAFLCLLEEILQNLVLIEKKRKPQPTLVQGHTKHLIVFSSLLSRKLPVFTILRLNFLINRLHLESCVEQSPLIALQSKELRVLIVQIKGFIMAVKSERPYRLSESHNDVFLKLVKTWNTLCLKT